MGWICKEVVRVIIQLIHDPRYDVHYMDPTWSPVEYNRARCHNEAVDGGWDWLLMMDADNPPRGGNPLDLIELQKDIIGLPTMVYQNKEILWNAMDWTECNPKDGGRGWMSHHPQVGLQEIDAIGAGCILIRRNVLCAMQKIQPWVCKRDERGYILEGEDFAFCKKAKSLGYRIWTHYDYFCEHWKEHPVHEFTKVVVEAERENIRLDEGQKIRQGVIGEFVRQGMNNG